MYISLTFHDVIQQLNNVYFLKSRTKTVPSLAEAPTLSPRLFQQTSKIPPVPWNCEKKIMNFILFFLISHLVTVNQLSTLSTPNMNTFVRTSACQKFSIRRKCNAVNWFFVSKLICSKENYQNNCYLVRVWTHDPLSTSQSLTVESKLAEAKTRFMFGLLVPGPVGLHFMV